MLELAIYISTIDVRKGYWHILVANSLQEKTAFVMPLSNYEFIVMPFCLAGTPSISQRMMNSLLADVMPLAANYFDDVTIFSNTWEDHVRHLH